MSVQSKTYQNNLINQFRTGDAIFIKSKAGIMDTIIRFLSKSSFIHAAMLVKIKGLWFVIETRQSSYYGYQMVPMEWWAARHSNDEVYLGKMPSSDSSKETIIRNLVMAADESLRPYKIKWIVLTYLLQVWFGIFRPNLSNLFKGPKPLICSTLIQEAWERAGIIKQSNYMTPGDLVDLIGGEDNLVPMNNEHFNQPIKHFYDENVEDHSGLIPSI